MRYLRDLRIPFLAAALMTASVVASAQVNPLYEHRRLAAAPASTSEVAIDGVATLAVKDGVVMLSTRSSQVIEAGAKSGDPVIVSTPTGSLRVRVAFRDEIDRSAKYHARTGTPFVIESEPKLIVDRSDPRAPITIDGTSGSSAMSIGIQPGQSLVIRVSAPRG